MLRFNIKEDVEIKLELYKNRHEIIGEIPLDYVDDIKYKFNDIDEMSITIPQYIANNGEKKFNRLYRKISTRQIIIVTTKNKNGTEKKQKFTLANKKGVNRKNVGSKSFTAYSWEKTLERQKITVDALARQLTNKDDSVHVGEGILDLICKKTGWKVGYVDQDARTKTSLAVQSFTNNLFNNLTINKVTENGLIFDKDVNITVPTTKPLFLTFHYTNANTYDSNGNLLSSMNPMNDMTAEPLYASLKNIKAYHHNEAGNRYGIRYVLTMTDNVSVEKICTFTNCINKKLTIDTINLAYDFGDVVEQKNVQYANFEAFDDSALKFLKDIQDVFECYFQYDTMTNTINTYAYKNLNKNSDYPLTLGENVIEINTTEDESIPTMLKVESENTSIIEHNPNGSDFVENYSYYIKNNLISDSLKNALSEFDIISKSLLDQWNVLKNNKAVCQQKYTKAESENTSLSKRIQYLTNLLSSYFNSDSARQYEIKLEVEQLESRIAILLGQMSTYLNEIKVIDLQIETINGKTQKANMVNEKGVKVFSSDDLEELSDMREVISLSDNMYTTPYGLYEYAKKYLEDKANPKITFDLTTVDLVNLIQNPRGWNNILELGSLFPVEDNEVLTEKEIRLVEMELVPIKGTDRVKSNSFKFSNKIQDREAIRKGGNIGKTVNKSVSKMTTYSQLWEDSKLSNNFIETMISKGLDVASANITGRVYRNSISITEAGIFLKDMDSGNNGDHQLYLGSSILAFTEDGWKHSKTAIDANGVIAETIIGKLILGEKLIITNTNGSFYIGNGEVEADKEFGLSIYDDLPSGRQKRIFLGISKDTDGIQRAKLRLIGKQNQELCISEDGILESDQYIYESDLDPSNDLEFTHIVDESVSQIRKCLLLLTLKNFSATVKSTEYSGSVVSNSNTTSEGGGYSSGQTTNVADNHRHIMFGKSGATGMYTSEHSYAFSSSYGGSFGARVPLKIYGDSIGITSPDYIYTYGAEGGHSHSVSIYVPPHSHSTTSSIDLTHNHTLVAGIFKSTKPSGCNLYINGNLVGQNINTDASIDISQYLKIGNNKIKITSATLGRIQCTVFNKQFVRW